MIKQWRNLRTGVLPLEYLAELRDGKIPRFSRSCAFEKMPADLRAALERLYLGRRFKNDSERLERLFELYTKMTAKAPAKKAAKKLSKKKTQ